MTYRLLELLGMRFGTDHATVGVVDDILFDATTWYARYFVIGRVMILSGRKLLVRAAGVGMPDRAAGRLASVLRRQDLDLLGVTRPAASRATLPLIDTGPLPREGAGSHRRAQPEPFMESARALLGFDVYDADGETALGSVADFELAFSPYQVRRISLRRGGDSVTEHGPFRFVSPVSFDGVDHDKRRIQLRANQGLVAAHGAPDATREKQAGERAMRLPSSAPIRWSHESEPPLSA